MEAHEVFQCYKRIGFTTAYQMLGTIQDTEDILQDVYLLSDKVDWAVVRDPKSYFTRMVINSCKNRLKSARDQKEVYPGPWLPEPIIIDDLHDPLHHVIQTEKITYALTVLIQSLTDLERTVFVLREVLVFEYSEISSILERSEPAVRKIFSRTKQKLEDKTGKLNDLLPIDSKLVSLFIDGAETGDFTAFIELLTGDVELISDGGGKVLAALRPIVSKVRVKAFLEGIYRKGSFIGAYHMVWVFGGFAIVQEIQGEPVKIILFNHGKEGIKNVYFVMNPDKIFLVNMSQIIPPFCLN
ncbi:sigma-70 family RNA polymerase sigma factor [Gracilibacillus kekensis]|uniref:RNA polymerase sigma-70 factor, ECF subfamily n=1 Tax=Gracilibacillus kekensis TaxID=1027249 RepID=A0A1M7NMJ2_9BACI|nr:sigma-70 family RNA polymerase sigma factor [Gracilibacillus kekensis]SHN05116.1 RNA polymerase sigma-70 factor, ECF subfamily [Gracilibacillus kekensis]